MSAANVHLVPGVLRREDAFEPVAPVVFDSPHSGYDFPDDFRLSVPLATVRDTEDSFVDELFAAAPGNGAMLLAALFPRSFIDPNRDLLDIDPDLLAEPWPEDLIPTEKTRLGLGLIRRVGKLGKPIYDRKLPVAEVQARIDAYYRPYHRELAAAIEAAQRRFGAVWHVNCHSMHAVSTGIAPDGKGNRRPDFCLGDRDGSTCDGAFTALVGDTLEGMGYSVTVNDPYKGVELVRRYGDPGRRRHSLQIEINRGLYMTEETREKSAGFRRLEQDIGKLVAAICDFAMQQT